MSPTLEMSAVALRIGDIDCVRSLSLIIEPGEMVAVTGRSGAGKSSLINLAAGLQRATEGGIRVCGTSLDGLSENRLAQLRRDHVGLVFQTDNLLPTLSAAENIALALELAGIGADHAIKQATEALHSVDLGGREDALPEELSGGERQRVAVARALVGNKSLLLADEPTAALDELTAETITRLLRQRCEQGASVLLVTHAAGVAAWADRVIHLADGTMQSESIRGINSIDLKGVVS